MIPQVFIVGTGRCGTASLAALLSAIPDGRVVHEITPQLFSEVNASFRGTLSRSALVELLRRTRDPASIGGSALSGEANQRLSFVLPALAEAFPHARVVWLLRDGRDAVASMQRRLWYHPREMALRSRGARPWALHRIQGDDTGDLSPDAWTRLDSFARCCWYWSFTNRLIDHERVRLSLPVLPIRIERLGEVLPELWSFLELRAPLPVKVPHLHSASGGRSPGWRLWSPRQRAAFRAHCAMVMDRHYPDWAATMQWSVPQEVSAFLGRQNGALRSLIRVQTRPLRARMGWVRTRPARGDGWS